MLQAHEKLRTLKTAFIRDCFHKVYAQTCHIKLWNWGNEYIDENFFIQIYVFNITSSQLWHVRLAPCSRPFTKQQKYVSLNSWARVWVLGAQLFLRLIIMGNLKLWYITIKHCKFINHILRINLNEWANFFKVLTFLKSVNKKLRNI